MSPKTKDGDVLLAFSGKWVTWAHTFTAYGESPSPRETETRSSQLPAA